MTLLTCPDCQGKVSDKAFACPSCGYPMVRTKDKSAWPAVLGGVAGAYISAQALFAIIVGTVMLVAFAAIMITLIVAA